MVPYKKVPRKTRRLCRVHYHFYFSIVLLILAGAALLGALFGGEAATYAYGAYIPVYVLGIVLSLGICVHSYPGFRNYYTNNVYRKEGQITSIVTIPGGRGAKVKFQVDTGPELFEVVSEKRRPFAERCQEGDFIHFSFMQCSRREYMLLEVYEDDRVVV